MARMRILLLLVLPGLVFGGCGGVPISLKYSPASYVPCKIEGNPKTQLEIRDIREEKIFFRSVLGDGTDAGEGSIFKLARSPSEILKNGFTRAMQTCGYDLRREAPIIYEVGIKRFLAIQKQDDITQRSYMTDIILDISIKKDGQIIAREVIYEEAEDTMGLLESMGDVVPRILSKSLSQAIESALSNKDLITAITQS